MKFRYAVLVKTEKADNGAEYGILLGRWFDEISDAHSYKDQWTKAYIDIPMFIVSCVQ